MWEKLKYLVRWVGIRCQQQMLNGLVMCVGVGANSILYQSNKVPEYILKKTRLKLFMLFRYLGGVIGESSSCVNAINARFTAAQNGFRELLQIITNRGVWQNMACIKRKSNGLTSTDNGMVHWVCGVRLELKKSTKSLVLLLKRFDGLD